MSGTYIKDYYGKKELYRALECYHEKEFKHFYYFVYRATHNNDWRLETHWPAIFTFTMRRYIDNGQYNAIAVKPSLTYVKTEQLDPVDSTDRPFVKIPWSKVPESVIGQVLPIIKSLDWYCEIEGN